LVVNIEIFSTFLYILYYCCYT